LTIDTRRQRAVFMPWTAPGQSLTFDTDPERVVLQTADGQTIDSRTNPRSPYAGHDPHSPWDALQVGYFLSYGMWNYLTTPFLLAYPGVQVREISPWQQYGQTWRRLHASFPASITTHSPEQVFYFGDDGLLRRLDYTVEADGGRAAHYTEGYKTFDGLAFPTRRRVYRPNPDGTPASPAALGCTSPTPMSSTPTTSAPPGSVKKSLTVPAAAAGASEPTRASPPRREVAVGGDIGSVKILV
jgi:hypothetical protein